MFIKVKIIKILTINHYLLVSLIFKTQKLDKNKNKINIKVIY